MRYGAVRFFRGSKTGLQELLNRFPSPEIQNGDSFFRQTIQIGNIYYRNCVRITVSPSGLFLLISIPFPGIYGGMMLIPWDAITIDGQDRRVWKTVARLRVEGKETRDIAIPENIAHMLPIT